MKVSALYFTNEGFGPDYVNIRVHPFPAGGNADVQLTIAGKTRGWDPSQPRSPEVIPATLGLRVEPAGEPVLYAPVGAGLCLERAQVADLHRMLGEWLEQNR